MAEGKYAPDSGDANCRRGYCLIPLRNNKIAAIIWRRQALGDACAKADIVISHIRVERGCLEPQLVVTPVQISRDGGMLIWIMENKLNIRRVNTDG